MQSRSRQWESRDVGLFIQEAVCWEIEVCSTGSLDDFLVPALFEPMGI